MTGWQPVVDGDRCVLARLDHASCRACIQACPRNAWQLTEEALTLDTAACDGCGLCAPACPESAIPLPFRPLIRHDRSPILLAGCAKALPDAPDAEEGMLPCVYSLGTADLLAAWHKGVRTLVLVSCPDCPSDVRARWEDGLQQVSAALSVRGAQPFDVRREPAAAWPALTALPERPATSRRGFLRSALAGLAEAGLKNDAAPPATEPPGTLLPPGMGPMPWSIQLSENRCTACLQCTRICPHGALVLAEQETGDELQAHSLRCTGCRLCLDVCEPDALQLLAWQAARPRSLALQPHECPDCRATFHVPAGRPAPERCPTCAKRRRPDPRKPLID